MDYIVILCIGILAFITMMMMCTRSMVLRRFGAMEFFTLCVVTICICLGYGHVKTLIETQYIETVTSQLENISLYIEDLEILADSGADRTEMYQEFENHLEISLDYSYRNAVLIERQTDGNYTECVICGTNIKKTGIADEDYLPLIEKAVREKEIQWQAAEQDGILFVVLATSATAPEYVAVVNMTKEAVDTQLNEILQQYLLYGGIILIAAAFVYGILVFREQREIRSIMKFTTRISEGIDDTQKVLEEEVCHAKTNEMRALYNGLRQISNDVMRINYTKYKTLQVYYRFAPKDIEKIMGKKSILDVSINEQVNMEATLAYISFNINERLEQHEQLNSITACYTNFGEKRKKHGGIIFNSSSDLSTIQVMFNREVDEAVQFGVEMVSGAMEANGSNKTFILLHRTSFVYGISGDEEQNFTFVHSAEMKCIEKYIDALRKMGIRMAVTDYVYSRLPKDISCRYAGYIEEGPLKFRLYEILEVYPERERNNRIEMATKFEEAIKLFYQADFYFARTMFADILKNCPNDNLVKHYIFKCENCLNGDGNGKTGFSLFG